MSPPSAIFARPPMIVQVPGGPERPCAMAAPRRGFGWPGHVAAFSVGVVLVISPLPNGSNHPVLWLVWAIWCGLAAVAVSLVQRRPPALPARLLGWIGATLTGAALFQALPLPGWRGGLPVQLDDGPAVMFSHLSIAPGATLLGALRQAGYLLFFQLALLAGQNPARARALGWLMFMAAVMQALYAIASLEWLGDRGLFADKTAFAGMATGSFVSKNALAEFLGMGLVLGLAFSLSPSLSPASAPSPLGQRVPLRQRAPLVAGLALLLTALVLTQSRMGLAAGLVASGLVLLRAGARIRRRGALLAGGLLILALLGLMGSLGRLLGTGGAPDPRAELYPQVLAMIARRPLSGYGLDSFPLAFELVHAPPVTAAFIWDKAHSVYLSFWAEMGVIAGSLPLLAGAIAASALWRRSRSTAAAGRTMALAALAALGLVALHGLVDFAPQIPANTFFLLGLTGLALGPVQYQERGS